MYIAITVLKSKLGFIWDDENGMNMTQDKQWVWDDMVKVCEHLSNLSMMSNCY